MKVFLLVREDQNQHGFVDTGVIGVFRLKEDAERCLAQEVTLEVSEGTLVDDQPDCPPGEWQVALRVEEHEVS